MPRTIPPRQLIKNPKPGSGKTPITRERTRPPIEYHKSKQDYRQLLFCHEYTKDCNVTAAAERAGYSTTSASSIGSNLLKKHKQRINRLLEEKYIRIETDADDLAQELTKIAKVNAQDLFDEDGTLIKITELPRHIAAAIQSFEVITERVGRGEDAKEFIIRKVKLWDKRASIETLMKYLGVLVEKKELTGKDGKDLIPSTIVHTFDMKNLTQEQLDALITLSGDVDPMDLIPLITE